MENIPHQPTSPRPQRRLCAPGACLTVACLLFSRAGTAADRFEIQVYDGSANEPGVLSLENHVSLTARGDRRGEPPEAPTDRQVHWTLETALGATRVWEPGVYLQTAFVPGEGYGYAGAKLRSKFMVPHFDETLRLGVNFEIGRIRERFEADQWGTEIRPIVALDFPTVKIAVNPILGVPLAHGGYRDGPDFEPAISVKGVLSRRAALGIEYYAALGPVGSPSPLREQEHYFYAAVDADLGGGFALNYGVGYGLAAAEPLTLKAIIAYEFGRVW